MNEFGELRSRVDRANCDVVREIVLRTRGGRVQEVPGLLLTLGRHPSPMFMNVAISLGNDLAAEEVVQTASEIFEARGHRWTLTTREHSNQSVGDLVRRRGWGEGSTVPGMAIEHEVTARPTRGTVRIADPARDLERFRAAVRDGYGGDSDELRDVIDHVFEQDRSIGDGAIATILEVNGTLAATAVTMLLGETAVILWVCTLDAFRGQGFGGAVTASATNLAFEQGASVVALQASDAGYPVYQRLGFHEVTQYRSWLAPLPESRAEAGPPPFQSARPST